MAHSCRTVSLQVSNDCLYQMHFCIKKAHVYMCVLITIKIYYLLECKYGHFCHMCSLETKQAVCSPQVPGESRQQDLLKYLGESCGNCNWPVIVNICWIFRFALQQRCDHYVYKGTRQLTSKNSPGKGLTLRSAVAQMQTYRPQMEFHHCQLSWLCKLSHDYFFSSFSYSFDILYYTLQRFCQLLYINIQSHLYIFEYSFIVILHTTNRCFSTFYL